MCVTCTTADPLGVIAEARAVADDVLDRWLRLRVTRQ